MFSLIEAQQWMWVKRLMVLLYLKLQRLSPLFIFFTDTSNTAAALVALAQPPQLLIAYIAFIAIVTHQYLIGLIHRLIGLAQLAVMTNRSFSGFAGFFTIKARSLTGKRQQQYTRHHKDGRPLLEHIRLLKK